MLLSLVSISKGIQPLKFDQIYFSTLACHKNGMEIGIIVFVKFANFVNKKSRFWVRCRVNRSRGKSFWYVTLSKAALMKFFFSLQHHLICEYSLKHSSFESCLYLIILPLLGWDIQLLHDKVTITCKRYGKNYTKSRKSCHHKRKINRIYIEQQHYNCLQLLSTLRVKTCDLWKLSNSGERKWNAQTAG